MKCVEINSHSISTKTINQKFTKCFYGDRSRVHQMIGCRMTTESITTLTSYEEMATLIKSLVLTRNNVISELEQLTEQHPFTQSVHRLVDLTKTLQSLLVEQAHIPIGHTLMNVVIVASDHHYYALPVNDILYVTKRSPLSSSPTHMLEWNHHLYPVISLNNCLSPHNAVSPSDEPYVILCKTGNDAFGLSVSRICEIKEIIVQPSKKGDFDLGNALVSEEQQVTILDVSKLVDVITDNQPPNLDDGYHSIAVIQAA